MARRIGIIGGTGLDALGKGESLEIETAHGPVAVTLRAARGREYFFLPRHGPDHAVPPHRVNYRANVAALAAVRADWIVGVFNAGSLRPDLPAGSWALPDDFLDFTKGRSSTFFDDRAVHVDMGEPFCPHVRESLAATGPRAVRATGVYAAVEGPRFETAAELRALRGQGADLVGMTGVPEVVLARELGLCYGALCFLANAPGGPRGLDAAALERSLARRAVTVRDWIDRAAARLPQKKRCRCKARGERGALGPSVPWGVHR